MSDEMKSFKHFTAINLFIYAVVAIMLLFVWIHNFVMYLRATKLACLDVTWQEYTKVAELLVVFVGYVVFMPFLMMVLTWFAYGVNKLPKKTKWFNCMNRLPDISNKTAPIVYKTLIIVACILFIAVYFGSMFYEDPCVIN